MHVLIIPSWYPNSVNKLSGIFFKEQAEALADRGLKVGLISVQDINMKIFIKRNKTFYKKNQYTKNGVNCYLFEYISVPKLVKFRYRLKLEIFKKVFKRYIKENGMPDIVHLHSVFAGECAVWLKKRYKIPFIVTEHSSKFVRGKLLKEEELIAQRVYNSADKRVAVSLEFCNILYKQYHKEFLYIPNIVDTEFFKPFKKSKKDNFTFINIAFLDKNKNQKMLIEAFYSAFKNKTNVKLTIVGDGPEYSNLKHLIDSLNLQEQVTLYGRANREEVKELLQNSDAFVLSSIYETFGVVILEALSCGLPVVTTKSGGPESIIINNKLGYLSDINKKKLADCLFKLYANIDSFDPYYLRKYVKDNFSKEEVYKKIIDIYKRVI